MRSSIYLLIYFIIRGVDNIDAHRSLRESCSRLLLKLTARLGVAFTVAVPYPPAGELADILATAAESMSSGVIVIKAIFDAMFAVKTSHYPTSLTFSFLPTLVFR